MTIEFHGAARTVTGSMHLLHVNGHRLLLDCGMFQGRRGEANERNRRFPFDPKSIDAVLLSHAHIDHSGNLPNLVKQGFQGPIYCTEATKDLSTLMLKDSGSIHERDVEYLNRKNLNDGRAGLEPLYTEKDAELATKQFQSVPYATEIPIVENTRASFTDAGHILGSASIRVISSERGRMKTVGFTGDIGRCNMPIIKDPAFMGEVEVLICECTYGGIVHDAPEDMGNKLAADLAEAVRRIGKVIIPAFSVGRTQDIVFALHKLFDDGDLPRIPIFIDSPLAISATEIFKRHPECFDEEVFSHIAEHHDPFGLGQLHYIQSSKDSKKLNELKGPCVVVSASGMCESGRILHHLAHSIGDPRNTILIVGYQAQHTLGRRLVDGETQVTILGTRYNREARVIIYNSFSAHADGNELLRYLGRFNNNILQRIFLVHGDFERALALQAGLWIQESKRAEIPEPGWKVEI